MIISNFEKEIMNGIRDERIYSIKIFVELFVDKIQMKENRIYSGPTFNSFIPSIDFNNGVNVITDRDKVIKFRSLVRILTYLNANGMISFYHIGNEMLSQNIYSLLCMNKGQIEVDTDLFYMMVPFLNQEFLANNELSNFIKNDYVHESDLRYKNESVSRRKSEKWTRLIAIFSIITNIILGSTQFILKPKINEVTIKNINQIADQMNKPLIDLTKRVNNIELQLLGMISKNDQMNTDTK